MNNLYFLNFHKYLSSLSLKYCCPAWDRCPAGASPFFVEGSRKPLGCNWMANNCPEGYTYFLTLF
jgi:hypothetical protein